MSTFVYILVGLAVLVLLCLLFLYLNKAQTEARPNGKYRLKSERYDGWEERAWYNEKFDTIEEARIAAKALMYDEEVCKVLIFEGKNLIESIDTPFPEGLEPYTPEHEHIGAKCLLPESLFGWAKLVKTHGESECWTGGRNIRIFEVEENEQIAVKGVKWVKSYLMPALTYESQIVSYFYTRLNLRRRVWEDADGNKFMANHTLDINGFIKVCFNREVNGKEYSMELSAEDVSTPEKLLDAYEKADDFFELKKAERVVTVTATVVSSDSQSSSRSGSSKGERRNADSGLTTSDVYADESYSFRSKNLADQIEREKWLDELDRSEKDDPWD